MKSTWGVIVALVCTVAGLLLLMRTGDTPEDDDRPLSGLTRPGAADRGRLDERRPAIASTETRRSGAAGRPDTEVRRAGGGPDDPGRRGEAAQTIGGDRVRQPPSAGAADGRLGALRNGAGRQLTLPERAGPAPEAALTDHDVPAQVDGADARDPAEDTDDAEPDEIPEVAYDGADQVFDAASQVEITDVGEISGDAGTISFWLKPEWERGSRADADFVQLGDGGLQILKEGDVLRFQYADGTGNMLGGGADMSEWTAGHWRHVTATWAGSTLSLYIDGGQMFANGSPTPPNLHGDSPLYVGSAFPSGIPSAAAQLSHLTVLNRAASGAEIMQMYASGGGPLRR